MTLIFPDEESDSGGGTFTVKDGVLTIITDYLDEEYGYGSGITTEAGFTKYVEVVKLQKK
jgi:hypothetical protein